MGKPFGIESGSVGVRCVLLTAVVLGAVSCSAQDDADDDREPGGAGRGGQAGTSSSGGTQNAGGAGGALGSSAAAGFTGFAGEPNAGGGRGGDGGASAGSGVGGEVDPGTGGAAGEDTGGGCIDGSDCSDAASSCDLASGACRAAAECDLCTSDADCGGGFVCYNFSDAGVRLCSKDGTCCQPPGTNRCVVDLNPPNLPAGYTTSTCYPGGTCPAPSGDARTEVQGGSGGTGGTGGDDGDGGPPGLGGSGGSPGSGGMSGMCPPGHLECDGSCVSVSTNEEHCGACGVVCGEAQTCAMGNCACTEFGQSLCDGDCTNLLTDMMNCGECGYACPPGSTACSAGTCL